MYALLVILVVLVALWLLGGIISGWTRRAYGAWMALGSMGIVGLAALSIILFVGPYWIVIYDTVLQPG